MSELVLSERDGGVLVVTLNRPEKHNALTGEMYAQLHTILAAAAEDPAVRAVLLRGAGASFTAGNDLKDFASWNEGGGSIEDVPVIRLIRFLVDFDKPLAAAVKGAAVGFGTTLLLHCDLVLAAPSVRFAVPFVRLGLVPEFGSSLLLPALGGRVRASQTLLRGETFGLERGVELGLVSEVVEEERLEAVALERCREIAGLPTASVRATKRLLNPPEYRERLRQAIDTEVAAFAEGLRSPEHREAIAAFFDKRQPDFRQFD